VWVTVLIQDRLVGFCSAYAPNASLDRCSLWDWIASSLPAAEWVIGSDFNMVEWSGDRDGGSGSIISSMEC
jgi:hypothetical protein